MSMNEGYVHDYYFIAGACTPSLKDTHGQLPTLLAPGFNPGSSFPVEALLFTSLRPSKMLSNSSPCFLFGPFLTHLSV
jgi:hypothetical protein